MATCNSIQMEEEQIYAGDSNFIPDAATKQWRPPGSGKASGLAHASGDGQVFPGIIGNSPALDHVLSQVGTVAPTGSTVLIEGETGTGKELIARAIHNLSPRSGKNFVRFNCAAVPAGLLESELFGYERGAFTGALTRKIGRFELADKGTLFLDEIGDIPLDVQSKLLRALQEQEFEKLGSNQTQKVNVRLVTATNRDLKRMVAERQFRSDLYFRLNIFPIAVPSLRERHEDIPLLVKAFVNEFAQSMGRSIETIPQQTMNALVRYPWPGNIRELRNFIERAVILSKGTVLSAPLDALNWSEEVEVTKPLTLEEAECDHILKTLKGTGWVVGGPKGAAEKLGLKRTTLIAKMYKLGLSRPANPWAEQNYSPQETACGSIKSAAAEFLRNTRVQTA
jgi:formate hydrogenlyase transcriptional activator